MKKLIRKNYVYAMIALWAVACIAFFQFYYKYHFFYQEQNQIFLMTWEYARSYFSRPAWAACLAGDFLTQFYYYLYAGPLILTATLLTLGDIIRRSLQRAGIGRDASFGIAIIAMTLEAVCYFRTDFHLSSSIALIGGAAIYYACSFLIHRKPWLVWGTMLIASVLTLWMFNIGIWIFLILIFTDVLIKSRHDAIKPHFIAYIIPIMIVPLSFHAYTMNVNDIIFYPGIGKLSKPNFTLESNLAADNEYYFGNYNKVITMVEADKHPTPQMSFFYNLASAQMGLLPENMLKQNSPQLGTFIHINQDTPILTIKMINELYWALGDMTFTERAAMMANVFSPCNRNVRMIKRLAEANIVSGDSAAAYKYLSILNNTLVYHKWAQMLMNGNMTIYKEKQKFINRKDTLRTSDDCRTILTELLESNKKNTIALDYLLCSDLLAHQIGMFKKDYDKFGPSGNPLYQQVLTFYQNNKPEQSK